MIVEATADDFAAILGGRDPRGLRLAPDIAPAEVLTMLANLAASIREVFAPSAWMIVEHDEVAGLCSLHRAPAGGELWIGYGVAPNRQGRGIATRAVEELILWARADPRVQSILAETHVANPASRAVLKRNGFLQTGRRSDEEDGELLSWALRTPP